MILQLGRLVTSICAGFDRSGVLLFFPTYALLSMCKEQWGQLDFGMTVLDEPKGQDANAALDKMMADHRERCKMNEG